MIEKQDLQQEEYEEPQLGLADMILLLIVLAPLAIAAAGYL